MKTKKIAIAVLCAMLVALSFTALAACSKNSKRTVSLGTANLDIDNYIESYEDYDEYLDISRSVTVSMEKMFEYPSDTTIRIEGPFAIIQKNAVSFGANYKYDVYSLLCDKIILRDITGTPSCLSNAYNESDVRGYVLRVSSKLSVGYSYDYYLTDGQEIFINVTNSNISAVSKYYYINDAKTSNLVYLFSAEDINGNEIKSYIMPKKTEGKTVFSRLDENSLSIFSADYNAGQTKPLYELSGVSDEFPVESEMKDYQFGNFGSKLKFFKNGKETGSLDFSGKQLVGIVDRYLYYYDVSPLSTNVTSGYNYCGENDTKAFYTMCRYDIIKNKIATFNYDVHITAVVPVYNKVTKAYDGAYVTGYKKIDGVYYDEKLSSVANLYRQKVTYFTNSKLNVACDFSSLNAINVEKLAQDRYLIYSSSTNGSATTFLTDKHFNIISIPGSSPVYYPEQGLVRFTVGNYFGFADFDGKIVIEPKYTDADYNISPAFYNDYILLKNAETGKSVFVNKAGEEKPLPVNEKSSGQDITVTLYTGYYQLNAEDDKTATSSIYTFDGKPLQSFDITSSKKIQIQNATNCEILQYNDGSRVAYFKINRG